jgi:hypothetical protein
MSLPVGITMAPPPASPESEKRRQAMQTHECPVCKMPSGIWCKTKPYIAELNTEGTNPTTVNSGNYGATKVHADRRNLLDAPVKPKMASSKIISDPLDITDDKLNLIKRRRFVILEGVPGTGKTHIFKEIKRQKHFHVTRFLTFHPSSDYSSFIGGIRPGEENDELIFNPTKGHLLKILEEADEKGKPVLLWIDELNRANVPRVFGDLISLIGNSDPPALQIHNAGLKGDRLKLTDNQKKNLHIVATMNTSDRSVTPLDAALRRRFSFVRLQPMNKQELWKKDSAFKKLDQHVNCFLELNEILKKSMGEDAIMGHSYLFEMLVKDAKSKVRSEEEIKMIWKYSILPNIVDTLMLTQNFDEIENINIALADAKIPLKLEPEGKGLGEIILVEG